MVALPRLRAVRLVAELRQLFVEGLHGISFLTQNVLHQRLLAVLQRLLFREEFLDDGIFGHEPYRISLLWQGIGRAT